MNRQVADAQTRRALEEAARNALPLVQRRRAASLRDTESVALRLTMSTIGLCLERGFDGVTVDEIAVGAGVNRRTFFRYFPNKEAVFLDILDQTNSELVTIIGATDNSAGIDELLRDSLLLWCRRFESLLAALRGLSNESRVLSSAVRLHASDWEDRVAAAVMERFPDVSPYRAAAAGVLAMGALRIASREVTTAGHGSLAVVVRRVFSSLQQHGHDDRTPKAAGVRSPRP